MLGDDFGNLHDDYTVKGETYTTKIRILYTVQLCDYYQFYYNLKVKNSLSFIDRFDSLIQ